MNGASDVRLGGGGAALTRAGLIGAVALTAAALGGILYPAEFFRAYLVAYLYCLGLALGSLVIVLVHNVTGGAWGVPVRRFLEAATRTLPVLTVLFVPVALGVYYLYPWTDAAEVALDPLLQHKELYLNLPFFFARAAVYFLVWLGLAYRIDYLARRIEADPGDVRRRHDLRALSAPGLILYGVTVTFAGIDWVMSLEPHWFSSIFGVLVAVSQMVPALALAIVLARRLLPPEGRAAVTPGMWGDLGGLQLAFVMLWAYIEFSQFFLIWAANLPEETIWYLKRGTGGWEWLTGAVAAAHFGVPFFALLSGDVRRDPNRLAGVGTLLLVASYLNWYWLVQPAFAPGHGAEAVEHAHFTVHWLDPLALAGVGGLWVAWYVWCLQARPLLATVYASSKEAAHHA